MGSKPYSSNSPAQKKLGVETSCKAEYKGNERSLVVGCGDRKCSAEIARYLSEDSVLESISAQK